MSNLNRKNFFTIIGLSALGLAITSLWSKNTVKNISNLANKKVQIKIHPKAVKRTSKA
jgi:hypothetical protein